MSEEHIDEALLPVEALRLDPRSFACAIHTNHSPVPWTLQAHHVWPKAWTTRLGVGESRKVPLCPTGHDAVHARLRDLIAGRKSARRADPRTEDLARKAHGFWLAHSAELGGGGE